MTQPTPADLADAERLLTPGVFWNTHCKEVVARLLAEKREAREMLNLIRATTWEDATRAKCDEALSRLGHGSGDG